MARRLDVRGDLTQLAGLYHQKLEADDRMALHRKPWGHCCFALVAPCQPMHSSSIRCDLSVEVLYDLLPWPNNVYRVFCCNWLSSKYVCAVMDSRLATRQLLLHWWILTQACKFMPICSWQARCIKFLERHQIAVWHCAARCAMLRTMLKHCGVGTRAVSDGFQVSSFGLICKG